MMTSEYVESMNSMPNRHTGWSDSKKDMTLGSCDGIQGTFCCFSTKSQFFSLYWSKGSQGLVSSRNETLNMKRGPKDDIL